MKKIGILGGTFDPIHNGHVNLAKKALNYFNLNLIYVIPTGNHCFENKKPIASRKDRLSMAKIAFKKEKKIIIKDIEIKKNKLSYTIETINFLKKNEPENIFFLILGSDVFFNIKKWKLIKDLAEKVFFIVALRDKSDKLLLNKFIKNLPVFLKKKILLLPMLVNKISSSNIRINRIEKNKDFIPKSIFNYILERDLYINEI